MKHLFKFQHFHSTNKLSRMRNFLYLIYFFLLNEINLLYQEIALIHIARFRHGDNILFQFGNLSGQ